MSFEQRVNSLLEQPFCFCKMCYCPVIGYDYSVADDLMNEGKKAAETMLSSLDDVIVELALMGWNSLSWSHTKA